MTLQSPISFIQKSFSNLSSPRESTWLSKILLAISCHGNRKRESIKYLPSQRMQGWEKMLGEKKEENAQNWPPYCDGGAMQMHM